jgi:transposase
MYNPKKPEVLKMNYTQNAKIAQVTEKTLIIGVDIGSERHYARAFNWRGQELCKKVFHFDDDVDGYKAFENWAESHKVRIGAEKTIVGFEPTGHYWFNFGKYVKQIGMMLVLVNPYHVKQTKELDDNIQQKDDCKDPKVIAKLVFDGRYFYAYRPKGIYAELRVGFSRRCEIMEHLVETKNRISRWFSIYFPEYMKVYRKVDASTGMKILRQAPLPKDIIALGVDGVNMIWRDAKQRGAGKKRATTLVTAAQSSIGSKQADQAARMDLWQLLDEYDLIEKQLR